MFKDHKLLYNKPADEICGELSVSGLEEAFMMIHGER